MIIIIDYGLGNLGSVKNALDKLNVISMISDSPNDIKNATGLILPGVGAAGEGMKNIRERKLDQVIREEIGKEKPLLGICLGMQLLMSKSEEGDVDCLDIIPGTVRRFTTKLKVPQVGWNIVQTNQNVDLYMGVPQNSYFYFVHSYYCSPTDGKIMTGKTDYQMSFCSSFAKKNTYGVQFHPEKSGDSGLKLLENFTKIAYENYSGD